MIDFILTIWICLIVMLFMMTLCYRYEKKQEAMEKRRRYIKQWAAEVARSRTLDINTYRGVKTVKQNIRYVS